MNRAYRHSCWARMQRGALAGILVSAGICVTAKRPWAMARDSQAVSADQKEPIVDRRAFGHHGDVAFISRGTLWDLDGTTGKLTKVAGAKDHPSDPQIAPNGRWLSYALKSSEVWVARANGASPHLVGMGGPIRWLSHDKLAIGSVMWDVSNTGVPRRVGMLPRDLVAWNQEGNRFAFESSSLVISYARRSVGADRLEISGSLRGKRVTWYSATVSFSRSLGAQGNFIDMVMVLPDQEGVLFTLDPYMSASVAADGLGLYELRSAGGTPARLGVTVGNTVTIGPQGSFSFTSGAGRYAWSHKTVVICAARVGGCARVPSPKGKLSLDPEWSTSAGTLAFIEAMPMAVASFSQRVLERWYSSHTLWVLRSGARSASEVPGTQGASAPVWAADGKSLMYVADDSLWLLPSLSGRPVRIESPLFDINAWPSYYGQISWSSQFAWSSS